ncbi:MAG: type II toxin-antitoxin system VapC family toxin [Acidobacteria bacterium]|nr:type II toxin-antitoxin system VapC family toxin [Acidobacteriota bacterium]
MIVIDASAVLEVLLRTSMAEEVESLIFVDDETLHAPHLIDLEVTQVLRRYQINGRLDDARGFEAISDFRAFSIERYPHDLFLGRIWALRRSLTAYDAAYVALAETLDATLVTCDARLAASSGHEAEITLVR